MEWLPKHRAFVIANYRRYTLKELSEAIGKRPKAISEWMRTHGLKKYNRYTETERYMLENFPASACVNFINASPNALRIKRCRILNKK